MTTSDDDLSSFKYDVFISFRGADTRHNFTSHLYGALDGKKILSYKDDVTLPRGDEISPALRKAIEDSRISIVVFSENYATSSWCLDELVHILMCKREKGQVVLPVFYKVDPSHVRKQKESYAHAFVDHEMRFKDDMGKVNLWRSALEEAGNLSGWDSRDWSEYELVQKIAQDILSRLNSISATNCGELESNLVGIEKHVAKIVSMLSFESLDVRIVGIWGMGGIGKTTLADVVYRRFSSKFESCFFEDVSNKVKTLGTRCFVKEFFAKLLDDKGVDMNNSMKNKRLQRTKVFVVLDNVDEPEQLEFLVGASKQIKSQFAKGSKIILTSRDKKLLQEVADDIYKVESLYSDKALELFYRNAFRRDRSKITDFIKLSKKVVDYTGGNPLALKVLGSYLHSRSSIEWESALSQLKKAPNEKVQKVLRISYDALDPVNRSIFLDIGCFFIYDERERVEEILGEGCHIGINVFVENSLITIDEYGGIRMHDLIKEMVLQIVREESPELGRHSRLRNDDVIYILEKNKGSTSNEVIFLNRHMSKDVWLQPTVFEAMENLRIIIIDTLLNRVHFDQGLEHLPDSLRYLYWPHYPLESFPPKFEPQNLVRLEMRLSKLKKLWDGVKRLDNLKYIDLSYSKNLIELLFEAPKLEYMYLRNCTSLRSCSFIEEPPTLDSLKNLSHCDTSLDLSNKCFERKPSSIREMTKLKHLNLSCCISLKYSLPDLPSSLEYLDVTRCVSLKMISARGCTSLKEIEAYNCTSLERIKTQGCTSLINIEAERCTSLETIEATECRSLERIKTQGCTSLIKIEAEGCTSLQTIEATECLSLTEVSIDDHGWEEHLTSLMKPREIFLFCFYNCLKLEQSVKTNILNRFQRILFGLATSPRQIDEQPCFALYSGNEIPNWITHQQEGNSITVTFSQQNTVKGFVVSAIIECKTFYSFRDSGKLRFKTHCGITHDYHLWPPYVVYEGISEISTPHVYMIYINTSDLMKQLKDDVVEAVFDFETDDYVTQVKTCGVRIMSLLGPDPKRQKKMTAPDNMNSLFAQIPGRGS